MATQIEQIDWLHWFYRLIALAIDGVILAIVSWIIGFVFLFSGFVYFLFFSLIWGIIAVLYFTILDVSWGATLGKRLMGLQVQMVKGGRAPFDKAFIRNISKIFWPFLILDWLIGILTPGDKHQKYSDRIAGTTIVQARQVFAAPPPPPPPPPPPS